MEIGKVKCSAGDIKVLLDVPKGQQIKHWRRGVFYEHQMLEHIYKNYSGGTFIDAGSALGNHTMFFAKFCKCKVYSIEPIVNSLQYQLKMLELNGLDWKVVLVNSALSDYDGYGSMSRFGDSVGHWKLETGDGVEVRTLDSLVDEFSINDVTLVKLDIEWSEIKALKGAMNLIKTQHPAFFIESNTNQELKQIMSILKPYGYERVNSWHTNHEYRKVRDCI